MGKYMIKRILIAIPVLIGITIIGPNSYPRTYKTSMDVENPS